MKPEAKKEQTPIPSSLGRLFELVSLQSGSVVEVVVSLIDVVVADVDLVVLSVEVLEVSGVDVTSPVVDMLDGDVVVSIVTAVDKVDVIVVDVLDVVDDVTVDSVPDVESAH